MPCFRRISPNSNPPLQESKQRHIHVMAEFGGVKMCTFLLGPMWLQALGRNLHIIQSADEFEGLANLTSSAFSGVGPRAQGSFEVWSPATVRLGRLHQACDGPEAEVFLANLDSPALGCQDPGGCNFLAAATCAQTGFGPALWRHSWQVPEC